MAEANSINFRAFYLLVLYACAFLGFYRAPRRSYIRKYSLLERSFLSNKLRVISCLSRCLIFKVLLNSVENVSQECASQYIIAFCACQAFLFFFSTFLRRFRRSHGFVKKNFRSSYRIFAPVSRRLSYNTTPTKQSQLFFSLFFNSF